MVSKYAQLLLITAVASLCLVGMVLAVTAQEDVDELNAPSGDVVVHRLPVTFGLEIPGYFTGTNTISLTAYIDVYITELTDAELDLEAEVTEVKQTLPERTVFAEVTVGSFEPIESSEVLSDVADTDLTRTSIHTTEPEKNSLILLPTPTFTPLPTEVSLAPALPSAISSANLRSGPGTSFAIAGGVKAGDVLDLIASNSAGDWYELHNGVWIAAFLVNNAPTSLPISDLATYHFQK